MTNLAQLSYYTLAIFFLHIGIYQTAFAQEYCIRTGAENPFDGIDVGTHSNPTLVDFDNDGDLDLVVGSDQTTISYYENDGSNNYTELTGASNPFDGINSGPLYSSVILVDEDGDGDLDLIIGRFTGDVEYYQNDGSGNFTQLLGVANPFDGITGSSAPTVELVDTNGDGDLDLVVGTISGGILYMENDGTGVYTQLTGAANPFDGFGAAQAYLAPTFADVDGDGDLDMILGNFVSPLLYFENDGSGNFTELIGAANPFDGIFPERYTTPEFADVDGDGDLDMIIGGENGTIFYYKNVPTCNPSSFSGFNACNGSSIPFVDGIDIGDYSAPTFGDVDGDGDFDMVVGENFGEMTYFENDGSGNFTQLTGAANPFDGLDAGNRSRPFLGDLDGDGDLDLVSGNTLAHARYFENDGTGVYTELTGAANPFDGVDIGNNSAALMADWNNDGNMDMIMGERFGTMHYFENDGSNNFTHITGTSNPFNGIDGGSHGAPAFIDADNDGDLDILMGEELGPLVYFENDGSGNFTQITGAANPFDGFNPGRYSTPAFVDLDGDGDLDLICGNEEGTLIYFENGNLSMTMGAVDCANNGEVTISVSSTDAEGPYTISNAYSGSIGSAGVLGANATIMSGITSAGEYGFEVHSNTGCLAVGMNVMVVCASVELAPKILLQGPFNGTDMNADLSAANLVPLTEPYTASGYTHVTPGGGETTTAGVLATTGPAAVVDWVVVELRDPTSSNVVVATRAALLLRNGNIVERDGVSAVRFVGVTPGNYYVAVNHRNHLGVMTATAILVN